MTEVPRAERVEGRASNAGPDVGFLRTADVVGRDQRLWEAGGLTD